MKNKDLSIGSRIVLFGFMVLFISTLTGCIGMPELEDIDYNIDPSSNKIHNLRYYGRDLDAQIITTEIIEETLLDTSTEEYGYYSLSFGYIKNDGRETGFFGGLSPFYLILFPLIPLIPVGLPTDIAGFDTYVSLALFDSNGDLIQRYSSQETFRHVAGLYYGWYTIDDKLSKYFSEQIQEVFDKASRDSEDINETLELIGPVNANNRSAATKNLEAYIFEKDVYIHQED